MSSTCAIISRRSACCESHDAQLSWKTRMMFVVIASVVWLQGCWQMTAGDRIVEEQWMAPRGGVMLEMGRTVRGDQLVEYEWVLLRDRDGVLEYEAHPSGQPVAVFSARTATLNEVVFE